MNVWTMDPGAILDPKQMVLLEGEESHEEGGEGGEEEDSSCYQPSPSEYFMYAYSVLPGGLVSFQKHFTQAVVSKLVADIVIPAPFFHTPHVIKASQLTRSYC